MAAQATLISSQKIGMRASLRSTARPVSATVLSSKSARIGYGAHVTPLVTCQAARDGVRTR